MTADRYGCTLAHVLDFFGLRDYRWLWLSTLATFMAFNMQMVARAWLILRLTEDSPLALGLGMASFALPSVFVSLIGGALADRIPKKQMLVTAPAIIAVVTLVVATLDITNHIRFWHLLLTGLINGSMMAVNMPSRQAMVSDIVPDRKLMTAVAMMSSGMNLTRIVGPAVAGVMIVYIDTAGVFYVIAGMYMMGVVTTAMIDAGKAPRAASGLGVAGDIKAGFSYAAKDPTLFGLLVMVFIPVLFGMSYFMLLPAWAREALDVQSDSLGMLMMVMGIGGLVGTLVLAGLRNLNNRGAVLLICPLAWGICLATFSQTTTYATALPLLLLTGMAGAVLMTLNMTLLQLYAPPEMRGRVMSIAMMSFGVMPLSVLPFAALAERVGTPDALLLSGVLLVVFTMGFTVVYPHFRRIA